MKNFREVNSSDRKKNLFSRQLTAKPACPFCGLPLEKPKELVTRRPQEMPVGSCACGAVYAYDATGHNLGAAFIEALVFSCNLDWDLAWGLLPEEDYLEKIVENYDYETNLIVPGGFHEGRKVSGALYFVRLHADIQEVTRRGVEEQLASAKPASPVTPAGKAAAKTFTKSEVEELVKKYTIAPLLTGTGPDQKTIRHLQRLLYSADDLTRFRAAEFLGRACAVIASKNPRFVSGLLQGLFTSLTDTAASSWGAVEAIGEIISNSPDIFAGYIPSLDQLLEEKGDDKPLQAKILLALSKIAGAKPGLIKKPCSTFFPYLSDPHPAIRAGAVQLLGNLGATKARNDLKRLQNDEEAIAVYENGQIEKKTIGQLAAGALLKI
ncbi:MAG: PBS lyase [Armatimonadetes bacterium]|nr:PBS lyase [Armatimonadota bacterium]